MDDEPKIHYAPCQNCGKPTPCFAPSDWTHNGLYYSKECRAAFKAKLQDFMKTLSKRSD